MTAGTRRIKSVEDSIRDTDEPEHRLRRHLSGLDLTVFGVGVIIGTGIFVLTGEVAKTTAGPATAISFVIAGIVCGLAALCYAEFASTVPVAGSAYTFSYATLGEFIAWIIGWDLVLELALGAATVSVGWSGYLNQLLGDLGIPLPTSIAGETATINIPAIFIALLMTGVLILGIKLSSRVTSVIVAIKIVIVLLVIVVGIFYVKADNYTPFVPPATPGESGSGLTAPLIQLLAGFTPSTFGVGGILAGAAIVFFAFIGFDIVATAAEETKNPAKDLPRGIIGSLVICTVLYVAVSLVVVGMQKYTELSVDRPAGRRLPQRRAALLLRRRLRRRPRRAHLGRDDPAARPVAGAVRDEPRPAAAAGPGDRAPALRHAVPDHPDHRRRRRAAGRVRAAGHSRRARQHRHPVRVHPGVDRGDPAAPDPPRPAPLVPGAVHAGASDRVRTGLLLPDAQPARRRPGCGSSSG